MRLLNKEFLEIFEDLYKAEEYDLNDIYSKDLENKGLIICYLLATETSLITIELKPKNEEIGVPLEWYRRYDQNSFKEKFSSLYEFLIEFDYDDFETWHLKVLYKNVEVEIGGKRGSTIIRLTSDEKYQLNILPLLYEVETKSYDYNDCDKTIMKLLKEQYKQTTKRAVLTIKKLLRHQDIYDEFVKRSFLDVNEKIDNPITVQGFTAEQLHNNFPLSILGSYNYLIFLREKPEDALDKLKQGLPRK